MGSFTVSVTEKMERVIRGRPNRELNMFFKVRCVQCSQEEFTEKISLSLQSRPPTQSSVFLTAKLCNCGTQHVMRMLLSAGLPLTDDGDNVGVKQLTIACEGTTVQEWSLAKPLAGDGSDGSGSDSSGPPEEVMNVTIPIHLKGDPEKIIFEVPRCDTLYSFALTIRNAYEKVTGLSQDAELMMPLREHLWPGAKISLIVDGDERENWESHDYGVFGSSIEAIILCPN